MLQNVSGAPAHDDRSRWERKQRDDRQAMRYDLIAQALTEQTYALSPTTHSGQHLPPSRNRTSNGEIGANLSDSGGIA